MTAYERLRHLAEDPRVLEVVGGAFFAIRNGATPFGTLSEMAEGLCELHGLTHEVHHNAVVFYPATSRAKQPACIIVSRAGGQFSPSAGFIYSSALTTLQVFEGDADDRDMAGYGAGSALGVETKGRLLLN